MISFDEDIGAVSIVDESEVSALTSAGYILKGVIQETVPTAVSPTRQDYIPSSMEGCIGMYSNRIEIEYILTTVSKYILALPRDKATLQMQEERAALLTKVGEQEKALAAAEFKLKEIGNQLTQALATCKSFASEQEEKNQLFTTLRVEKNVLQEDLKKLQDTSKNVERLTALEDWVIQLTRSLDPKILEGLNLGPLPFMNPKTWAERLIEDEDDLQDLQRHEES